MGRNPLRRPARLSEARSDKDLGKPESEGHPEVIFVLLAGAIYGMVIGLCIRGEFAVAFVATLSVAACVWLGWWIRGGRA